MSSKSNLATIGGAVECYQHPSAPNHFPVTGGNAVMAESQSNALVECACGCGQMLASRDNRNRPKRFIWGHNARGSTGNRRPSSTLYLERGRRRIHIVIAEAALGKPLPIGVHVHHVDENKWNNTNKNLVICQDAKYHQLLHARARVLRAGGNPNLQRICCHCKQLWTPKHSSRKNQCPLCCRVRARHYRGHEWSCDQ